MLSVFILFCIPSLILHPHVRTALPERCSTADLGTHQEWEESNVGTKFPVVPRDQKDPKKEFGSKKGLSNWSSSLKLKIQLEFQLEFLTTSLQSQTKSVYAEYATHKPWTSLDNCGPCKLKIRESHDMCSTWGRLRSSSGATPLCQAAHRHLDQRRRTEVTNTQQNPGEPDITLRLRFSNLLRLWNETFGSWKL